MAVEVDAHEERGEVAYLVVVLHLLDALAVDAEVGHEEERGGEAALDAEVDRGVVGVPLVRAFLLLRLGQDVGGLGHGGGLSPGQGGGEQGCQQQEDRLSFHGVLFFVFSMMG